ncbi:MAG: hypothetical protein HOW97_24900 [Catenulispora sp.]|nr:hypothetical protein [Catenulispora sp.]
MGWDRGDADRGGASEPPPFADAAPIEVELVDDDAYSLPDDTANMAIAGAETIGGGSARRSRFLQAPRTLRVLGTLAAAAALTVAVWPSPNAGPQAAPRPAPQTPTQTSTPSVVNTDLYKVNVAGTSLVQDYRDHAIMGLELANDATTRLTVVNAEVWDAVQTRLGYSATWPAGDVAPGTTKSVQMDLPYSCGVLRTTPVLPVTIRYSVSTPDDLSISHNYEYPVTAAAWEAFMQARAGLCTGPAGGVFAVSSAIVPPSGSYHGRFETDLMLTMDSVGRPGWTLVGVTAAVPGVSVTSDDLPVTLAPGQSVPVRTHWQFADCMTTPRDDDGLSAVEVRTRPAGAPVDGSADQQLMVYLRPELMARMMQASCPPISRSGPR